MNLKKQTLTLEQCQQREYNKKKKELLIARTRAVVVRNQIAQAYEILENIRFDYLNDTAFRDKIVGAKQGCELAIKDFLLDDRYWSDAYDEHIRKSVEEYSKELLEPGRPIDDIGKGSTARRQSD